LGQKPVAVPILYIIHPPWDSTKLSLSTLTTYQESEKCGKLSFIEDTLITEESLLFEETQAISPTGKREQEKAKCNPQLLILRSGEATGLERSQIDSNQMDARYLIVLGARFSHQHFQLIPYRTLGSRCAR
jgi:hypothetical protein